MCNPSLPVGRKVVNWRLLLLWVVFPTTGDAAAAVSGDAPGYVGSASCGACHAEQFDAWSGSHHDLAMQPANESTVLGDFNDQVFEHRGLRTRFYREGERFMIETQGADGAEREYEISYTFGVTPLQQYLVGLPDGRYQALTVAWDSRAAGQGGQRWFSLYPNEDTPPGDELHWLAPAHNWNHACAECHSTNLQKNYDASQDRFTTSWSEIDVGCEACHGPGSRHVQLAREFQEGAVEGYPEDHGLVVQLRGAVTWGAGEGMAANVVAAQAGRASEVELCGRCHARRTQLTDSYRHGAPLSDTHRVELLEEGLYFPDGQILDEVYVYGSFRQSHMYAAGVTCSNCHDPHTLKLRLEGNALCTTCHQADIYHGSAHHFHKPEEAGGSCVACHMPERTYMVVDPRRDHSFRVPRPDLADRLGVPDVCTGCHSEQTAGWADSQLRTWYGENRKNGFLNYAETFAAARNDTGDAASSLVGLASDQDAPAIARATALRTLGEHLGSETIQVLVSGLYAADPLERLAAVEALATLGRELRWRLLSPLLDDPVRSVRIGVADALADIPVAAVAEPDRPKLQRVVDEYLSAQNLNADRAEHRVNLAGFQLRRGEVAAAEAAYRDALQLNPRHVPAYVNQADMYRALGREQDAEKVLRAGIENVPDEGSLHYSLGLLLVRTGHTDEALTELQAAYELDKRNPRFGYVYAVALDSTGAPGKALDVWKGVLELHPNDRETLQALAVGFYRQGEPGKARKVAERLSVLLPGNPSATELMANIKAVAGGQQR